MHTHIISNNVVVNTIVIDDIATAQQLYPECICIEATFGGVGWLWDGTALTEPPAQPVPVPQSVTMRQASLALLGADLLDDVEALVATLPRAYQIEWERASTVERSNPLVEIVRQQKSMTDAQIDDLFIAAATL